MTIRTLRHALMLPLIAVLALGAGCSEDATRPLAPAPTEFVLDRAPGEAPLIRGRIYGLARAADGGFHIIEDARWLLRLDPRGSFLDRRELRQTVPDGPGRHFAFLARAPDGTYRAWTDLAELAIFTADFALSRVHGPFVVDGVRTESVGGLAVNNLGEAILLDPDNFRVLVVDAEAGLVRSFGRRCADECGFEDPVGLAVGPDGSIYVSDAELRRVLRFSHEGIWLGTIPPAGSAGFPFDTPGALAVDAAGVLRVVEDFGRRIWSYSADGTFLDRIELTGGVDLDIPGPWFSPLFDAGGDFYTIALRGDAVNHFDASGALRARFGGTAMLGPVLTDPELVAASPDGGLFIYDDASDRVVYYDPAGVYQREWSDNPASSGRDGFRTTAMAIQPDGRLARLDQYGRRLLLCGPEDVVAELRELEAPEQREGWALAVGRDGSYYVSSRSSSRDGQITRHGVDGRALWSRPLPRVRLYWSSENQESSVGDQLRFDARGRLWVYNMDAGVLHAYDADGQLLTSVTLPQQGPEEVISPWDFDIEENGEFLISNSRSRRLHRYDRYGRFLERFSLPEPVDAVQGTCYPRRFTLAGPHRLFTIGCGRVLAYRR